MEYPLYPLAALITTGNSTTSASVTVPASTVACLIGVATTDARITFGSTAPTSTTGIVFPKGLAPVLVPVGNGATVNVLANSAGNSILTVYPLQA